MIDSNSIVPGWPLPSPEQAGSGYFMHQPYREAETGDDSADAAVVTSFGFETILASDKGFVAFGQRHTKSAPIICTWEVTTTQSRAPYLLQRFIEIREPNSVIVFVPHWLVLALLEVGCAAWLIYRRLRTLKLPAFDLAPVY